MLTATMRVNNEGSAALSLALRSRWLAAAAVLILILCGCGSTAPGSGSAIAQEPDPDAAPVPAPQACASYADCPKGMICAGAGGGATGTCMWPNQMRKPRPAYDPVPRGYLGSIYGQPVIQGQPPAAAPPSDAGGMWNMKDGSYSPPRGGKWYYRPAGANGFAGAWVYTP
jgi:hypothetical protein